MSLDTEITRLLDIMPASGRMFTKIISKPQQSQVIYTPFPVPWNRETRPIYINFDLWRRLSRPQRDLLLLRAVSRLTGVKWFKPDIYQVMTLAGVVAVAMQAVQKDVIGITIAGSLTAIAARQIWRNNRSLQTELEADEAAIKVALRRGYTETSAAEHLLSAMESIAQLESNRNLNFTELIRCQNLRTLANLSNVGIPETVLKE